MFQVDVRSPDGRLSGTPSVEVDVSHGFEAAYKHATSIPVFQVKVQISYKSVICFSASRIL